MSVKSIQGNICATGGTVVGSYCASICESAHALWTAEHFSSDHIALLRIPTPPVAFLRKMKIDRPENRRKGFGSRGLQLFRDEAAALGAKSAFARISDPETPQDALLAFYIKNGWQPLTSEGDSIARFAWLDLK